MRPHQLAILTLAACAVVGWLAMAGLFMAEHHRFPVGGGEVINWFMGW